MNTIEAKTYVIMCSLGQKNKKYIHKRDLKTATFQMPTLSPLKNYSGPTADVSW